MHARDKKKRNLDYFQRPVQKMPSQALEVSLRLFSRLGPLSCLYSKIAPFSRMRLQGRHVTTVFAFAQGGLDKF